MKAEPNYRKYDPKKKPEKSYAQILAEYEKRMAPIRAKRLQEARKRLKALKLQKPYTIIAKNQINPWIP